MKYSLPSTDYKPVNRGLKDLQTVILDGSTRLIVLVLFAVLSFGTAHGAGDTDPGFQASAFGSIFNGDANVVKVQPDGKILIGGFFTEANGFAASGITRLNPDGTTDNSFRSPEFFNESGIGREIRTIALQTDGKILVGGNILGADGIYKRGLMRLNADGTIDTSFNLYDLPASSFINDIEIQPDNKILAGGGGTGLFRLNADGSLDSTFTQFPTSNSGVEDIQLQPDGKIVFVGRNTMNRLTGTGVPDGTFQQSNNFTSGTNTTVKVLANGQIVVGGSFILVNGTPQRRMCMFSAAGVPDLTFNTQGPDSSVNDIELKTNGKILITGPFNNYSSVSRVGIAQINADGTLDTTIQFNTSFQAGTIVDLQPQSDGKVLFGYQPGATSVVRYNDDGTIDPTFSSLITRDGIVNRVLQLHDEKVLAAGSFVYANGVTRNSLARFNPDGSLDGTFALSGNAQIYALAVQPDGKILVGGISTLKRLNTDGTPDTTFTAPGYTIVNDIVPLASGQILVGGGIGSTGFLVRLNANGSVDTAFAAPSLSNWVHKILVLPNGKIVIGGQFNFVGANPRGGLARLDPNGSYDSTFAGITNGVVFVLGLQTDGKIIVGGSFSQLNGSPNQVSIGRLNSDGALDSGFVQSTNGAVKAIKVLANGKIVIGGTMSAVQGGPHNGIARLASNGSLDIAFTTFANGSVSDITLQSNGRILLGGAFTRVNGLSAVRIARLLDPSANSRTLFDYDGDGRADISVFRPSENKWYIFRSSDQGVSQQVFAIAGDVPVPSDFDGDGKTDIAIYRPSSADWWSSSTVNGGQINAQWGQANAIGRPSDFDGDGKSDYIYYLPSNSTWYRYGSTVGASFVTFGSTSDKPVTGDFDGDGKSDVAIYRPSTGDWWWQSSVDNIQRATHWGISTDVPTPADFDGDGKTDFAVFRPSTGTWYVYNSATLTSTILNFGLSEDKPVPADYDGDGQADIAVFRPSTGIWYLMRSTAGFSALQFGVSTDVPTPSAYVP